jgi:hypothetical protein
VETAKDFFKQPAKTRQSQRQGGQKNCAGSFEKVQVRDRKKVTTTGVEAEAHDQANAKYSMGSDRKSRVPEQLLRHCNNHNKTNQISKHKWL